MRLTMKKKSNELYIDPLLQKFYEEGNEKERLTIHKLEKDRTLQILNKLLPQAPAVIYDVGGAAGIYAFMLTEMGYEVHLMDPIAQHIEQAKDQAINCGRKLASYTIGDARKIEQKNNSADIVLFFGPLYHLINQEDRLKALKEAYRVLKPGGLIFAAAISRFASLMDAMHKGSLYSKIEILEKDLVNGIHRKIPEDLAFAYLHYPNELKNEVEISGFENVNIRAIEGPVWEKNVLDSLSRDQAGWKKLLSLLEQIEIEESIIGASSHIMAIGQVSNPKK